ncbi:formin-like protein 5 isoform X3 [Mangifera indica]|nr:formin-like protein 5 isoform X3 [Mangifera indica]
MKNSQQMVTLQNKNVEQLVGVVATLDCLIKAAKELFDMKEENFTDFHLNKVEELANDSCSTIPEKTPKIEATQSFNSMELKNQTVELQPSEKDVMNKSSINGITTEKGEADQIGKANAAPLPSKVSMQSVPPPPPPLVPSKVSMQSAPLQPAPPVPSKGSMQPTPPPLPPFVPLKGSMQQVPPPPPPPMPSKGSMQQVPLPPPTPMPSKGSMQQVPLPPPTPMPSKGSIQQVPPPPLPPMPSKGSIQQVPPPPPSPMPSKGSMQQVPLPPPPPMPSKGSMQQVPPPPPPPMPSKGSIQQVPPPSPSPMPSKGSMQQVPPPPPPPMPSKGSMQQVPPPPPPPMPSKGSMQHVPPPPPPPMPSKGSMQQVPPPPPPPMPSKGSMQHVPPPPPPPMPSKGSMQQVPLPPPPPRPSKGSMQPLPSKGSIQPPPPPPVPSKGIEPPPAPPLRRGPGPPPPPPLAVARTQNQKGARAKLKRSTLMSNLFRDLKGKMEGTNANVGSAQGRKKQLGGSSGGKEGMADTMAELAKRSSYFQQIEEDIKNHSKTILELKVAISSFKAKDMAMLVKFQKKIDSFLEVLTDESQVLVKFEDFPTKKLEALRAAAALYSKLNLIVINLKHWEILPPLEHLLNRFDSYFTKVKMEVDALERIKDEEAKKFKSQNIDFDFNMLILIKELMINVSSSCLELVLKERRETKGDIKLLWRAFKLAFRVYSFAGGQDDRADYLTTKLADEILALSPNP